MYIIDPGHCYEMQAYDGEGFSDSRFITFMKRLGPNYPGNSGVANAGTNCQEVLRILIDRCKYLNNQIPCEETTLVIAHLREALLLFEIRAARIKGHTYIHDGSPIESKVPCKTCGHIYPHSHLRQGITNGT